MRLIIHLGLNFTVTGDGTYTIDFGNGNSLTGVTAGEVTVGPITTTSYSIQVIQEGNPSCSQTLSGSYECVPSEPCTLSATASTVCNANGTYILEVVVTGDGVFNIDANGETQTGVSAGTYSFGAFMRVAIL